MVFMEDKLEIGTKSLKMFIPSCAPPIGIYPKGVVRDVWDEFQPELFIQANEWKHPQCPR